jgi:hypothetical protein
MSPAKPDAGNCLDKRPYTDRAYKSQLPSDVKSVWRYLVDRMWPYPDSRKYRQGWVMPEFLAAHRIASDTGHTRRTVQKALETLSDLQVIALYTICSKRGTEVTGIQLAPPGGFIEDE